MTLRKFPIYHTHSFEFLISPDAVKMISKQYFTSRNNFRPFFFFDLSDLTCPDLRCIHLFYPETGAFKVETEKK